MHANMCVYMHTHAHTHTDTHTPNQDGLKYTCKEQAVDVDQAMLLSVYRQKYEKNPL